jgi:phosphatidylglycerol lysyltransferase
MHATIELARQRAEQQALLPPDAPKAAPFFVPRSHARTRLTSVTMLAWAVRFSAMLNLLAFSEHHAARIIFWIADWVPFEVSVGRRFLMLLTAVMLFVLSSGLERGKRMAWLLTIGALVFAPLIHLGRGVIWPQMLLNLPLIVLLCAKHRYFVAQSDKRSLRSALIVCPVLLAGLLVFGTVRLHDLRFETSGPDSWLGCVQAAVELALVQNAHTQHALTHATLLLFSELRMGGTSIALLALFLALRPDLAKRRNEPMEEARMDRLLREHGDDPLHSYALLGDKTFFFDARNETGIPYVRSGRFAVALADPIGPAESRFRAIGEFAEFCRRQDWVPLFYQIADVSPPLYRALGFSVFQIGEDARVNATGFDLRGAAFQNLRTLCNKARKESLRFTWYDPAQSRNPQLEGELAVISAAWLTGKRGAEMTYDMGSFSCGEIRRRGAAVALDAAGRAVAFATWRHFGGNGVVLDLMRSLPAARNVLDFVLVESIRHFRAQGVTDISLGNAPLASAREAPAAPAVEDRAVRFLYENLNHVYAYKPLFEFKRKYRPQWRARYLAYPSGESLPLIGLALVRVHTRNSRWRFLTG